jgi:hypothetical protein
MSLISDMPLDVIKEDDLQRLVDERVFEGKELDYKASLPNFLIRGDKKEFLADISSFANAYGGDLIYGIKEDRGIPVDLCGLEIADNDIDKNKQQIESIVRTRSNIDPRITGLSVQPIKLKNGRYVIIIRIPKSWAAPHMVTLELKNNERFFSRTSSGKYSLDVTDLRNAFILSETLAERIRNFRLDRIGNILSDQTPTPLGNNPKIVLHLIPFNAFDPTKILDMSSLEKNWAKIPQIGYRWDNYRYNFDGILAYDSSGGGYVQLFRNGIIEMVNATMISIDDKLIPAEYLENELLDKLPSYISTQKDMGISPPILVALSLLGVHGCTIGLPPQRHPVEDKIDRDVLLLPESLIEHFEFNLPELLKPICDALWNASGYQGSFNKRWKEI